MPPKRVIGIEDLRRQTALRYKISGSNSNSAFATMTRANIEFARGKRVRDDEDDGEEDEELTRTPVRKKARPAVNNKTKGTPKKRAKTAELVIEDWRPAGGEARPEHGKTKVAELTSTLGIARIATWRLDAFTAALKTLIEQHVELEELSTHELDNGGESVTDVYVRFRSETVAEAVKEKINYQEIEGRKLQVKYA